MNYLSERVSYLRGLAEGLGIKDDTKEGKVLTNMIDILDDIVDAISELEASQSELDEYVETIDEDLSEVEEELYGEEDDDDSDDFVEVECPNCHDTVYFDEETFEAEDKLICPNCKSQIYDESENTKNTDEDGID